MPERFACMETTVAHAALAIPLPTGIPWARKRGERMRWIAATIFSTVPSVSTSVKRLLCRFPDPGRASASHHHGLGLCDPGSLRQSVEYGGQRLSCVHRATDLMGPG